MGWVRKLAARLVRDPSQADDLAQETLLTALHHPPAQASTERSLRAWLSRVLGNLVRMGARSELRRSAREALAARPERSEGVADVVGRASDQHLVVAAVLGLDEPYRSAILLRYFDGLSVSRIAARTECTPASVRKRLSRATSMLRARLQREFGEDRRSLAIALLNLSSGHCGLASASKFALGGVAVGTKTLAFLTCVGLALVLLWGRTWLEGREKPAELVTAPAATAEVPEVDPVAASPLRQSDPDEPESARVQLTTGCILRVHSAASRSPLEAAEVTECTPKDAAKLQSLVESCWESLGVEGATARRWLRLMTEEAIPPLPFDQNTPPFQVEEETRLGRTDEQGLFELPYTPSPEAGLVIRHVDTFPMLVPSACFQERDVGDHLEVDLAARGELLVHLIDGDGVPVEGAHVRIELDFSALQPDAPRPLLDSLTWHGPTDARGALSIPSLPAGVGLFITPFGEFSCRSQSARIDPASRRGSTHVRVWRTGSVRGIIEFEDGRPGRDLGVQFFGRFHPTFRERPKSSTDEKGAFLLEDFSAGVGRLDIGTRVTSGPHVWHEGIASLPIEIPSSGLHDLGRIVLPCLSKIEGFVWSSRVQPVTDPGPEQLILQANIYKQGRMLTWAYLLDEQLSFSFVLPEGEYELVIETKGGWENDELFRCLVSCPARDFRIDLDEAIGGFRARLPDGMPDQVAASARVYLPPTSLSQEGRMFNAHTYPTIPVRGGVLEFGLLQPGEYDVEISLGALGAAHFAAVEIEAGRMTDLGLIDPSGAEVSGVVLGPEGVPVENARVVLLAPALDQHGQGEPLRRETSSKADGSYRLALVEARQWQAYAHLGEETASALTRVDVFSGGRTSVDFHLEPPCSVRGRVTRGGEPVHGAEITWVYEQIPDLMFNLSSTLPCRTDVEGNYLLGPLLARQCRVFVRGSGIVTGLLDLSPGDEIVRDFELDPERTRLNLELPEGHGSWLNFVEVTCIDEHSPQYGFKRRGVISGEDRVDIALFPTQNLLSVTLGEWPAMHTVVNGTAVELGETVKLPVGVVELRLGAGHGERPSLNLIEVPWWGVGEEILSRWWRWSLPVVEENGTLQFLGIPDGARLMLTGRDERGRTVWRELLYEGPGPMTVDWP